jgi:hypothetical protein
MAIRISASPTTCWGARSFRNCHFGSEADHYVIVEQRAVIALPPNLTFYGTPPESAVGRIDIVIIARDIIDNSADAMFSILVGHR